MSILDRFKDAHFVHIPSQGSIYTSTCLKLANGSTKLLTASLKREIYCFEYLESPAGILVPTTKEVLFTYIPTGAEIISIDAFNKSATNNEFVIGITIIKNSNDSDTLETFLNIYSQLEENEDFNIENIAQNCFTVELNFIPYQLLHSVLVTWENDTIVNKEIVFILTGGDNQTHIYRENVSEHVYKEIDSKEYFPEFPKTNYPILYVDIYHSADYSERFTAFGCECGYFKVLRVCTKTKTLLFNLSTRFDNMISHVRIFRFDIEEENKFCDVFKSQSKPRIKSAHEKSIEPFDFNIVVVNTILPPVVFHNVMMYGLTDYTGVPRFNKSTPMISCEILDIDFDGVKEILMCNAAEELLLHKRIPGGIWRLEDLKYISAPVLSIKYIDVTGDGVKDLVLFSTKGIHIYQHEAKGVEKVIEDKVASLTIPDISKLSL